MLIHCIVLNQQQWLLGAGRGRQRRRCGSNVGVLGYSCNSMGIEGEPSEGGEFLGEKREKNRKNKVVKMEDSLENGWHE